ncbi:quinolinate synthase NadA [Candidatus Peregrinibacteria bacterium]|nr:quinolinate synthase NadA [Candidatus Peregrinibacteria bacterium]
MDKNTQEIVERIKKLKKKKRAIILVHNYQRPEVFKVADRIGDSLELCRFAKTTKAEIILFCGVNFMAESAKIINPQKKVLVPYLDAGCAMADMVDRPALLKFRNKFPGAAIVTYVNSTADVKAVSDVLCTSANAVNIVKALPNKQIIFVPDKNLANFVSARVPEKEIIPWDGYCPIHNVIDRDYFEEIKIKYPDAKILAHPESVNEILEIADAIKSTSGMIEFSREDPARDYFVFTECGMLDRLRNEVPGKNFYGVCNLCFDMKKNTLNSILRCLEQERHEVLLDKMVIDSARKSFNLMFELT